jgi:hypothetical protein
VGEVRIGAHHFTGKSVVVLKKQPLLLGGQPAKKGTLFLLTRCAARPIMSSTPMTCPSLQHMLSRF